MPIDQVATVLEKTGLKWAQLHGDESPEELRSCLFPAFKAIRSFPNMQFESCLSYRGDFMLFDGGVDGVYGGTGKQADWDFAKELVSFKKLFLAGGLSPDNVQEAIRAVNPFGVDVCGGVESSHGIKDHEKLEKFVNSCKAGYFFRNLERIYAGLDSVGINFAMACEIFVEGFMASCT